MTTAKKISVTLPFTAIFFLSGCCYLTKQGIGLARYQSRTVKIDNMLRKNNITPEMKDFLTRVQDIRTFAIDSIGLRRNKNYSTYTQIDRDYMVDVLVASRDDTFDLYKWRFPIVGSVPYKGFFDSKDAQKAARKIEKKGGYDIYIGKADAFSTLGFFSDPIYSFMINYSVYDLASLIIHEQMHATLFIKNQTQLNEEMATFVGDMGGLWYVRDRFGENSDMYKAAVLSKEDYRTYIDLMRELYNDLKKAYNCEIPAALDRSCSRDDKLSEKERIFAEFREKIARNYDSLFHTPRYEGLKRAELNNAIIAARMTYNLDMSLYYELYDRLGQNLAAVVSEFKKLKKIKKNHKDYLRF